MMIMTEGPAINKVQWRDPQVVPSFRNCYSTSGPALSSWAVNCNNKLLGITVGKPLILCWKYLIRERKGIIVSMTARMSRSIRGPITRGGCIGDMLIFANEGLGERYWRIIQFSVEIRIILEYTCTSYLTWLYSINIGSYGWCYYSCVYSIHLPVS